MRQTHGTAAERDDPFLCPLKIATSRPPLARQGSLAHTVGGPRDAQFPRWRQHITPAGAAGWGLGRNGAHSPDPPAKEAAEEESGAATTPGPAGGQEGQQRGWSSSIWLPSQGTAGPAGTR